LNRADFQRVTGFPMSELGLWTQYPNGETQAIRSHPDPRSKLKQTNQTSASIRPKNKISDQEEIFGQIFLP
jgi:hypothetical protein